MIANVCIPTLNSYETFWRCVESIYNSSLECKIYAIDNGGGLIENSKYPDIMVHRPAYNMGVAASWNWFIDNVSQPRIITNDDIVFDRFAIEFLVGLGDGEHMMFPENLGNSFSCFYLPNKIINTIGKFDETISPNYAYFEDDDYSYRMRLQDFHTKKAEGSLVDHIGSSTLKNYSFMETESHHKKFRAARERYIKKWGGQPGEEKFLTPYNK